VVLAKGRPCTQQPSIQAKIIFYYRHCGMLLSTYKWEWHFKNLVNFVNRFL
jgi:hypothetical protein